MSSIEKVGVLGAGVIGASWTALFVAAELDVAVYDPGDNAEKNLRDYVEYAWKTLQELGLATSKAPGTYQFYSNAVDAVREADFIQESVPEQLPLKHALYAEIEPHLKPEAIVASSASGLMVSEMQQGWKNPERFLLAHPFNPPHLIPLVELLANDKTAPGVLEAAEAFFEGIGKVTIRVKREVPAHVANRLQAALWREAIALVENDVASVEDVDKAIWAGPGLRWAAMGPHLLFNLAAGAGGMEEFCNRYSDSFHRWWDDLEQIKLNDAISRKITEGVKEESAGKSIDELSSHRDELIVAMLKSTRALR